MDIQIGNSKDGTLIVTIRGRQFPDSTDWADANWLVTSLSASVKKFEAEAEATLRSDEFDSFLPLLKEFIGSSNGDVVFEAMERQLSLSFHRYSASFAELTVEVRGTPGLGPNLIFYLTLDESALEDLANDIGSLLVEYPPVGKAGR